MRISSYLPVLEWARGYKSAMFADDLIAAIIVTLMLVPQSLAYAMLANLPPYVGLYASILPLVGYALFGSSRTLAVGPVAVVSLMTATAVGSIAAPGTPEFWVAAVTLAFLSGVILFAMGFLKLGFLANVLSHPVIVGFMAGSALLIALSQIKHLLGVEVSGATALEILPNLVAQMKAINPVTMALGICALGFLLWVRSFLAPMLRGFGLAPNVADILVRAVPILAVVSGIAVVAWMRLDLGAGVKIVGAIPQGLPPLTVPSFDPALLRTLLPAALAISIVGLVESISVAQSLAAKRRQRIDPDQELRGLGAANIAAAFSGGYPVTGGFARSVVNFAAGASTQVAGVLTAGFIALVALFLTPAFYYLPNAVLAATIIAAVIGLVDFAAMGRIWRYSKADGTALFATAIGVLIIGVEVAIALGVGLSVLLYLWRTSRPHIAVIGQVPGTEHYRNVLRHSVMTHADILAIRVDESLYFMNARYLEDYLMKAVAEAPAIRHVLLVMSAVNFVDASALESLETVTHRLKDSGIVLHLAEVKGPVMDRLVRSGVLNHLTGQIFQSTHDAMRKLALHEPGSVGPEGA